MYTRRPECINMSICIIRLCTTIHAVRLTYSYNADFRSIHLPRYAEVRNCRWEQIGTAVREIRSPRRSTDNEFSSRFCHDATYPTCVIIRYPKRRCCRRRELSDSMRDARAAMLEVKFLDSSKRRRPATEYQCTGSLSHRSDQQDWSIDP